MPMLKKENVLLNCEMVTQNQQFTIQDDVIISDTLPDVGKILQVDAEPQIAVKSVTDGSITISGQALINIIYITDAGSVKSTVAKIPVERSFSMPVAENDFVVCQTECESVEYNLINSRKVALKVGIYANSNATITKEIGLPLISDEGYQVKKDDLVGFCTVVDKKCDISIHENMEIPTTKPSMDCILKQDIKIKSTEIKIVPNKIIAKGKICINTLYNGEDGSIDYIENEVPFTEILDAEGAEENMICNISYAICEKCAEIREDSDGDRRILRVDLLICVYVKVTKEEKFQVITDIYSTKSNCKIDLEQHTIHQIVANQNYNVTVKDIVNITGSVPHIKEIYNIITTPIITDTKIIDGKLIVKGVIDTYILYITSSADLPVYAYKYDAPIHEELSLENCEFCDICDLDLVVEHISYNLGQNSEIDLRFILNFNVKVMNKHTFATVDKIDECELSCEDVENIGSIRVYFVQPNDTLWNIAKKYRVTIERLLEWNELEADAKIYPGMQIIIPA